MQRRSAGEVTDCAAGPLRPQWVQTQTDGVGLVRIYLDNCSLNRPLDDQTQTRIRVELALREPFDYTKWQRDLWPDRSVNEISEAAMRVRQAGTE